MNNPNLLEAATRKLYGYTLMVFALAILTPAGGVFATDRGISVSLKKGKSVNLYKDYHALVVGVSNYEWWPKLPNAVNDAKDVAAKLKTMGFEVKLALNPTSREMKTLLGEMVYNLGGDKDRALLFYYAGHGETETMADGSKLGYIIPRDCPLLRKDPQGFTTHAISMKEIESVSLRIRSKHVLMLFDSCFSGSLFALVRAVPEDITEKSTLPVRQYITAGREDEQVPDKSMFKRCFLLGLDGDADLTGDGYITGSELGMYLSDKVVNYTHRQQHPQYGKINNPDLDRGDFIFVPKVGEATTQTASLDAEIQRLAEEREQLRKERERLEAERRLLEERKRLEAERQRLEKERQKLSLIERPPAASIDNSIDKVAIGVLDFETAWGAPGGRKTKNVLMRELRRNPQVKLVDIRESCSLSDLKEHEYERAERFKNIYQVDMILHVYMPGFRPGTGSAVSMNVYFSFIDLYTKRIKEVSIEVDRSISIDLHFRGISSKLLVSQDLNRVLRAKNEVLGKTR